MAVYGLQTDYTNTLLKQYFGLEALSGTKQDIYLGLGLEQEGSSVNIESFDEVFAGRPLAGYERARVVFGEPVDQVIYNTGDVVFPGATEAWTSTKKVAMLGLFNTADYEDSEGNTIKPLIVLSLPSTISVNSGEVLTLAAKAIQLSFTDL